MKNPESFERHKSEYLELTDEDKEVLDTLCELWNNQRKAIKESNEFINSIVIEEDELNRMIDSSYDALGVTHKLIKNKLEPVPITAEEKEDVIERRKEMYTWDKERTEYYTNYIQAVCDNSGFNSQEVIKDVTEHGILYDVAQRFQKYIIRTSEPNAREILNRLEQESLERCDKCFTTSQEGSGTSTQKTKNDSRYDSIYFLYALSNGTYISQRFKRNMLVQSSLSDVVNPFLDLALFIGHGKGIDGILSAIKPGFYENDTMSTTPMVGMQLIEYYTNEFKNNVARGALDNVKIPDVVGVVDNGVILSDNFTTLFQHEHEGTDVNRVLK